MLFKKSMNYMVIDLEKLKYISSAGVRVILYAYKVMKKQGSMVLKIVPQPIMDVFSVVGLLEFFTIE